MLLWGSRTLKGYRQVEGSKPWMVCTDIWDWCLESDIGRVCELNFNIFYFSRSFLRLHLPFWVNFKKSTCHVDTVAGFERHVFLFANHGHVE